MIAELSDKHREAWALVGKTALITYGAYTGKAGKIFGSVYSGLEGDDYRYSIFMNDKQRVSMSVSINCRLYILQDEQLIPADIAEKHRAEFEVLE